MPVYDANSTGPVAVPDLDPGTGYGVILQTWRNGSALKSHATLPAGPAAPDNLAVNPGNGYLDLSWNAVTGATAYDIRARAAGVNDWHSVANKVTATTYRYTTDQAIDQVAVRAANAHSVGNWTELSRLPDHGWLNTVQSSGSASAASNHSGSIAAKLDEPATITVTRDNARDEKLRVSWAEVTGASGYNLACSDTGWGALDGSGDSGWWHCGSTTSATSLIVDSSPKGDLQPRRSYLVAVRAVKNNAPADASDWKRSEDIRPAWRWLEDLAYSRSGGSVTLSWTPNPWTTGYEIDCAVYGQTYTRCATLSDQDDEDTQHSVTISTWTVGNTTYDIDDGATYDIAITSTNQWGSSAIKMYAPLTNPIPNVSNLGETSDAIGHEVKSGQSVAVGFSTGDNSGGYALKGVTMGFLGRNRNPTSPINVAVHAASDVNPSASSTYTLAHVSGNASAAGNTTYACTGTCSLSANTSYFLVLSSATSSGNAYVWDTTASGNQTNSTNFGWTIDNGLKQQSGNSWSDRNWTARFRVSATHAPSLTTSNVAATTATLSIANHGDAWYYQATSGPHTSCQGPVAAGTSSQALTGLTAGSTYTYSAYSDSACATLLATAAEFTTPAQLTVSSISNAGATLTISGHTGQWWYQGGAVGGSVGTCTSESSSSVTLTGLDSSETYEYKAYSKANCAATDLLTTTRFNTLHSGGGPGFTASNVTHNSARLTLSNHTGDWWYRGGDRSGGDGPCTAGPSNFIVDLADLKASTPYTYSAYSDLRCTTQITSATTVTFSTLAAP